MAIVDVVRRLDEFRTGGESQEPAPVSGSSHSVYVSQPAAVADLIRQAAGG
ncbi:MAG TPA: hypothetical protein VEL03_13870 [Streptosporangiaceae bacterium]|nr:hypothetical protein [Streptosporangiaceae bacterium]